ncbi:unnamed protein product [Closterium sp. Yama58-4]|nr:unnamed protein product [Closterium sp. Yama58-4]
MGDLKHKDREGSLHVSSDQEAADSAAAAEAEGDAPLSPALSPGPDGKPRRRSGAMGFMSKVGQIGRNVKSGIEGSLTCRHTTEAGSVDVSIFKIDDGYYGQPPPPLSSYGPQSGGYSSYPPQGYPPQGYSPQGYPPQGYPPPPPPGAVVVTERRGNACDDFYAGLLACLCCCCMMDALT